MQNQKGFSLLETLVSLTLGTFIMLGLIHLLAVTAHQQAALQRKTDWNILSNNVNSILRNKQACSLSVKTGNAINLADSTAFLKLGQWVTSLLQVTNIVFTKFGSISDAEVISIDVHTSGPQCLALYKTGSPNFASKCTLVSTGSQQAAFELSSNKDRFGRFFNEKIYINIDSEGNCL